MNFYRRYRRELRRGLWLGLLCVAVLWLLSPLIFCFGCGPPQIPNGITVGPMLVDEPPELNLPLSPLDRLEQIRERCWEIRLRWHEQEGWVLTTKRDVGGIASEIRDYKAPTLGAVIMKVKP